MSNQIDALTAFLNDHGLQAAAWQNRRIYLNGYGRDIKAYIDLDDPTAAAAGSYLFFGAALRVFSNADQNGKWRANRAKQIKHSIMLAMAAADEASDGALFGPLGREVCEKWEDVIL
ncbi:MAG: hypothetical protein DCC73_15100 [Proteobacteria bacterium]|nr:MAG: hypothetical protein DCC73_15100 [Pseudomonadota bacterium]